MQCSIHHTYINETLAAAFVMAASTAPDLERARWAIQHAAHIAEGAAQLAGGAAGGRPDHQAPQQARPLVAQLSGSSGRATTIASSV